MYLIYRWMFEHLIVKCRIKLQDGMKDICPLQFHEDRLPLFVIPFRIILPRKNQIIAFITFGNDITVDLICDRQSGLAEI